MKIALIIVSIIIVINIVSMMVFSIINKGNDYKISLLAFGNRTEMIFQNEYDNEEINDIVIDVNSYKVEIQESNSEKIRVTAYGEKDERMKVNLSNNKLEISKAKNVMYLFAFFFWNDEKVIVEIPKGMEKNIQVTTSSGDIKVADFEQCNMQLEASSGKIMCGNINNGNLKASSGNIHCGNMKEGNIQTSSGSITCGNINIADLKSTSGSITCGSINIVNAKSTSGSITIDEIKEEGQVQVTSGRITIEKAKNIVAQNSSGGIRINSIENRCQLSATSGGVRIGTCDLKENSTISAKSGSVKIERKNNIYVNATSNSGNISIQNNDRKSEVELQIQTTSGSIKVQENI